MSNAFRGQCYEYGGDLDNEERGLTIGGCGSAFFADLVAAFALEAYRIGTSGVKEIPNPYENWWEGSKLNGVTICPEIGPNLAVSV